MGWHVADYIEGAESQAASDAKFARMIGRGLEVHNDRRSLWHISALGLQRARPFHTAVDATPAGWSWVTRRCTPCERVGSRLLAQRSAQQSLARGTMSLVMFSSVNSRLLVRRAASDFQEGKR